MLVNLVEILKIAQEKQFAVGAFNTPNLECVNAVLASAEKLRVPVILAHAQLHEEVSSIEKIGPVMLDAARRSKVPVCVHLDHCETLEYLQTALDLGFTGVMYDGSLLPYEENLANTTKAVEMAHAVSCGVEAELGALASREGGGATGGGPVYTDPDQAVEFCRETGIDAFAPSFGTAHGIYKAKPVLDLERVRVIAEKTGLPLVMHGGSGVLKLGGKLRLGAYPVFHACHNEPGVRDARKLRQPDGGVHVHEPTSADPHQAGKRPVSLPVFRHDDVHFKLIPGGVEPAGDRGECHAGNQGQHVPPVFYMQSLDHFPSSSTILIFTEYSAVSPGERNFSLPLLRITSRPSGVQLPHSRPRT